MNKNLKIALIVIGIIIVLVILFFSGIISSLNQPLNNLIAGEPDKSCNSDSDCTLRSTSCHVCDCGDAVNKDWKSFCPFPIYEMVYCKMCASEGRDFEIKCIDNQCQKAWLNQ